MAGEWVPLEQNRVEKDRVAAAGKGALILLVEDDADLLELSAHMLRQSGYDVLEASSGVKALELFNGCQEKIRLVITDVVMAEMTGPALLTSLREAAPEKPIHVLFFSGQSAAELERYGVCSGTVHFLQKPSSKREFLAKVQEILVLIPA